jgi:signal transduction histidine kinase
MIIKSAVRSLRRQPSPEVADIAASIDEEVSRLNRVVTGVLDFARPIRFDLAPADLVEICRDATNAAKAGPDAVPVTFDGHPPTLPLVTDAERLRAVLINLLSNAQQAVRARGGRPEAGSIRLSTGQTSTGGWWIEVADRGAGIAPEDLPRLFEPFFTTRKTGSGLGLPLSRNIVEGLGGAMAIDSTVGVGTRVRIDMPERAAVREVSA